MNFLKHAIYVFAAMLFYSCTSAKTINTATPARLPINIIDPIIAEHQDGTTDSLLQNILMQHSGIAEILKKKNIYNIQIIYTQINRDAANKPSFVNYYFNINPDKYFYPASTVKLPVALLALQKANELSAKGINKNTTMITEAAFSGQTVTYNDPLTPSGKPNIADYVKRIFLVSDNEAYNRLYEFAGQEYINSELQKRGFVKSQIRHRLDIFLTEEENRHTNPLSFYNDSNRLVYSQPENVSKWKFPLRKDSIGRSYYENDKLVKKPMNFSLKNKFTLPDAHDILKSLLFPEAVDAKQRFNLTEDDYRLVYKYMSAYPSEIVYPPYDTVTYFDAYSKFLLLGAEPGRGTKQIRIFNKEGDAYGQLTDVAYIVDFDKKIEFMVSATIYCNKNEILNDEIYEYDTIGYPFLKNLGKVLYDYELKRPRKYVPDLSRFKITYDK
ncbi:hypothetical protein BH09BAC2_BH09BAC2_11190 [soil metagenome]